MRILHTADWHIGQTLNGWSREAEHERWLQTLADVIEAEAVDVLLIAGDIFDGINPSGAAQKLFYGALGQFKRRRPGLVTVITSGNHDPAARLEAPSPILTALDVHVFASLRQAPDQTPDFAAHMVPLFAAGPSPVAWICAVPFLRAADLPGLSFATEEGRGSPIVAAARRFYAAMATAARDIAGPAPILAMGHLHCAGAEESEGAERRILIGGEHALPVDVFPQAFDYVALGHLHRPQNLDGGRIRYSGSPFPLSAAEVGYRHGVTLIEVADGSLTHRHIDMPRPADVIRIPQTGTASFADFEAALSRITVPPDLPSGLHPLIYVNLQADGPAAVLSTDAERLLAAAPLRTAGLRVRKTTLPEAATAPLSLADTSPEALFRLAFAKANGVEPAPAHIAAFREAMTLEG